MLDTRPDSSARTRSSGRVRPPTLTVMAAVVISMVQHGCGTEDRDAVDPFANPERPPAKEYDGPVFEISADYPTGQPPDLGQRPWQDAIGGDPITVDNAAAYAKALKAAVADDMTTLLYDFSNWDAGAAGWYNQPWLGSIRDGVHGTYQGSQFPPNMFPVSGLSEQMTTHVLVYYDTQAAYSLAGVWGDSALDPRPGLDAGAAQFPEGSIVVKPAFTTATADTWPPLAGASTWTMWASPDGNESARIFDGALFQFDIIVKDSQSAPETQWVFSTLVYDKDAPGESNWDKMVPLGAMWGNDPDVVSTEGCDYLPPDTNCEPLAQTWINPAAPIYAMETLGWGGRLSGPNDGAVDTDAAILNSDGSSTPYGTGRRYAMSSCMSCHGPAEYETDSFLLPSPSSCNDDACSPTTDPANRVVYYPAGSDEFRQWFQSRPGDQPQDAGTVALDYDMNLAFKALPEWFTATDQPGELNHVEAFNDYRGLSPDHLDNG